MPSAGSHQRPASWRCARWGCTSFCLLAGGWLACVFMGWPACLHPWHYDAQLRVDASAAATARTTPTCASAAAVPLQVLYNCRLGQRVRLVLAPFGARGRDAAYTLNPLTGQVGVCWQQACRPGAGSRHAAELGSRHAAGWDLAETPRADWTWRPPCVPAGLPRCRASAAWCATAARCIRACWGPWRGWLWMPSAPGSMPATLPEVREAEQACTCCTVCSFPACLPGGGLLIHCRHSRQGSALPDPALPPAPRPPPRHARAPCSHDRGGRGSQPAGAGGGCTHQQLVCRPHLPGAPQRRGSGRWGCGRAGGGAAASHAWGARAGGSRGCWCWCWCWCWCCVTATAGRHHGLAAGR